MSKLLLSHLTILLLAAFYSSSCEATLVMHLTGDGTAADASGNGHHGTLVGGTGFTAGRLGQGFQFDGVNDSVTVAANPALESSTFSIATWIQATPNRGLQLVADSTHGGSRPTIDWTGWALQVTGGNQIDLAIGNGSGFPHVTSTSVVADNSFHHVAATFDGSTLSMYIDGSLENTAVFNGTFQPSGRTIRFGEWNAEPRTNTSRYLQGTLDDIRIYDSVLSATSVAQLSAIPEPSGVMALSLVALGALMRRRRRSI